MSSASDIVNLFAQPTDPELSFRQGMVLSYNLATGENTINVGGTILTNIPILNLTASTVLTANDIVGLLRYKSNYFILGRIIIPPL